MQGSCLTIFMLFLFYMNILPATFLFCNSKKIDDDVVEDITGQRFDVLFGQCEPSKSCSKRLRRIHASQATLSRTFKIHLRESWSFRFET